MNEEKFEKELEEMTTEEIKKAQMELQELANATIEEIIKHLRKKEENKELSEKEIAVKAVETFVAELNRQDPDNDWSYEYVENEEVTTIQ